MKFSNRQIKTSLLTLNIWILLVSGCVTENTVHPTVTFKPSAILPIVADTSTPLPMASIISSPTIRPTPTNATEPMCLNLDDQLSPDLHLTGVWVRGNIKPYLENIETKARIGIPLNGNSGLSVYDNDFAVSSDKKWLAYIDIYINGNKTNKQILRAISSSGYSLDLNQWPADFQWIDKWSRSRELILDLGFFSIRKFTLLNPFTGKYQIIQPSRLNNSDSYYSEISFSPDLKYVASTSAGYPTGKLEIRDTKTEEILLDGIGDYGWDEIAWSPDSSKLAVALDSSVILYASDNFKHELMYQISDSNEQLVWAPDSTKIVFIGYGNKDITVLDAQPGKTTIYCIDDQQYEYDYDWENPFWSPDGGYLIVNGYRHIVPFTYPFKGETFDLLIDIKQSRAFYLPAKSSSYREAWLAVP